MVVLNSRRLLVPGAIVCCIAATLATFFVRASPSIQLYRKATYGVPAQFDPINSLSTADAAIAHLVYDGLVRVGPDLQIVPALADRWKISADGRGYIFHIRSGVKFHDGKPLSVSDVRASINRLIDPSSPVKNLFSHVESVSIISPNELGIELRSAYPPFLSMLAAPVAKVSRPHPQADYSIGTGVFSVHALKGAQGARVLTLIRNDQYFGRPPVIETMELIESTEEAAIEGVREGRIHDSILFPSSSNRFPKNSKAAMVSAPSASTWLLALNVAKRPTSDIDFRRCLVGSFDRNEFVNKFLPDHQPASGFIAPGLLGYTDAPNENPARPRCDRFSGTSITLDYPAVLSKGAEMCQQMGKYFSTIGVHTNCIPLGFDALLGRIKSKESDVSFLSQSLDLPDTDYFVNTFETGSPINLSNLSSPAFDGLAQAARSSNDRTVRAETYRAINTVIDNLALTVNISYPRQIGFFHHCLINTSLTVLGEATFDYSGIQISKTCLDREDFRP
jgi:peptide/nickel transport system substrate-binding protein